MKKYLTIASLCVGLAVDFLFWEKTPGISFAIFVVFCLAIGFELMYLQHIRPARSSSILLIPILLFCIMTFLRQDPFTIFMNVVLTLIAVAVLVITFQSGGWTSYNLQNYAVKLLQLIGSLFIHPKGPSDLAGSSENTENRGKNGKPILPVLRGVLLAVPILALFIALFSSADLVFAQKLHELLAGFQIENVGEYIFRAIYILISAYFFAGLMHHAAVRSQQTISMEAKEHRPKTFLGFTETGIILGSVILLFGIFIMIQFRYLFFGQSNIMLTGFTYAEYARRGFNELIAVAIFSLLLFQGMDAFSKRENPTQEHVFTGMQIGLVCAVLVILVSAFQRLLLYESAYGFSELRTYAHLFMIWLAILLIGVLISALQKHQQFFANWILIVLAGFTVSLNLMNVDAFIARQNIHRALQGEELDISYLSGLSDDAVPELVKTYLSSESSPALKEKIGAVLVCHTVLNGDAESQKKPWQSFHLSTWRADRSMKTVKDDLSQYQVQEDEWSNTVISPTGVEYVCQTFTMFD